MGEQLHLPGLTDCYEVLDKNEPGWCEKFTVMGDAFARCRELQREGRAAYVRANGMVDVRTWAHKP